MKHLAACVTVLILGLLGRLAGAVFILALPSMAAADGVAVRESTALMILRLLYIALPYVITITALAVSHRNRRLSPGNAWIATAAAVLLPLAALVTLRLLGFAIVESILFWDLFPAFQAAAVLTLYLYLQRAVLSGDGR